MKMRSQNSDGRQNVKQSTLDNQSLNVIDYSSQQISSQELDLEIYDQALNSQSTQSSQLDAKCSNLFQYCSSQNEASSQEIFGFKICTTPSQSSQSSNLLPSQTSIISSQCPNLSSSQNSSQTRSEINNNELSKNPIITDVYINHSVSCSSVLFDNYSSRSISSSQKTNYYNYPNFSDEIMRFETLTPEASQEDNVPTQIGNLNNINKQSDADTDETDEIPASDDDDEVRFNRKTGFITPNDSVKNLGFFDKQLDQTTINCVNNVTINQNFEINEKIIKKKIAVDKKKGKIYDGTSFKVNDENKFKSIGKSEKIIDQLEVIQANCFKFDNNQDNNNGQNIDESDCDFEKNIHHIPQINQTNDINLPSVQHNINLANNENGYSFCKIEQNRGKEIGINLLNENAICYLNQSRPNNQYIYDNDENALDLSLGKAFKNYGNQLHTVNNLTYKEDYMIVDLDDYKLKQRSIRNDNVEYYRAASSEFENYDLRLNQSNLNLSRSSTPNSFAPTDELTEDSNDSISRKRRKKPEKSLAKICKIKEADMKENAALKSEDEAKEMRSLSQQLREASIESPANNNLDDSRFEYYDKLNDYYSNKSLGKPSAITDILSNSAQVAKNSMCVQSSCIRSNFKENTLVAESSLNLNYIENFDTSIKTPKKTIYPGPMPKSTNKKSRSSRKSTQKDEVLIRRPPVQRKLKITESKPFYLAADENAKQEPNNLMIDRSFQTSKVSSIQRPRTLSISSVSSLKSIESVNDDDEKSSDIKKQKRREQNNESARNYRMRKKEKEKEMDGKIIALQAQYNEKRKELKKILVQKHSVINCLLLQKSDDIIIPDWMKSGEIKLLI